MNPPSPTSEDASAALVRQMTEQAAARPWTIWIAERLFPWLRWRRRLVTASVKALAAQIQGINGALDTVRAHSERVGLLANGLHGALRACDATIADLRQALTEHETDSLRRLDRLSRLTAENRDDIAALERRLLRQDDNLDAANARLARLSEDLAASNREIQGQVAAQGAEVSRLESKLVAAAAESREEIAAAAERAETAVGELRTRVGDTERRHTASLDRLKEELDALTASIRHEQRTLSEQHEAIRGGVTQLESRIADVLAALRPAEVTAQGGALDDRLGKPEKPGGEGETAFDRFYLAFENRYRGSQEEIRRRQQVYLPTLENLVAQRTLARETMRLVDLGCGRGEWLGLLHDAGFVGAIGVDLNPRMLASSREHALPVEQADALDYLRRQDDHSLAAVTAMHLVEHLPFAALLELFDQTRRVLIPGGLVILETPNCSNVLVATQNFHNDPTHRAPLPPLLLSFTAEHAGFRDVRILPLHPYGSGYRVKGSSTMARRFNDYFYGPQDYALLAYNP